MSLFDFFILFFLSKLHSSHPPTAPWEQICYSSPHIACLKRTHYGFGNCPRNFERKFYYTPKPSNFMSLDFFTNFIQLLECMIHVTAFICVHACVYGRPMSCASNNLLVDVWVREECEGERFINMCSFCLWKKICGVNQICSDITLDSILGVL